MTRSHLNGTLRAAYGLLVLVLALSLAAKFADWIPGVAGSPLSRAASELYGYLRDMALVFVTVVAVFLAHVFQKRSNFVESLEEEWRGIVRTKTALHAYCERPYPSTDDYIAAFGRISETIDNMRIVYRNVGETRQMIGLYPYAPLHDMRRALQSIDPRKKTNISPADRKLVQDAILQSFYALRENFLEELDLEEPARPLLISAGRRLKVSGCTTPADLARKEQRRRHGKHGAAPSEVDELLIRLNREEEARSGQGAVGAPTVSTPERPARSSEGRERAM